MENSAIYTQILVFLLPLGILFLGLLFGKLSEKKHYRRIHLREAELAKSGTLPVTMRTLEADHPVKHSDLARGSAVISIDHWKRFLTGFRKFFGGELHSYSSLLDRARREALLRMMESQPGADLYLNTRLETSSISKGRRNKSVGCVEVLAYSTAVWLDKSTEQDSLLTHASDEVGTQTAP